MAAFREQVEELVEGVELPVEAGGRKLSGEASECGRTGSNSSFRDGRSERVASGFSASGKQLIRSASIRSCAKRLHAVQCTESLHAVRGVKWWSRTLRSQNTAQRRRCMVPGTCFGAFGFAGGGMVF
eukprot:3934962-Rhodomonas_salina.1